MASISDIIEEFILENMGKSSSLAFSRNSLANHFSCVPSQINYVLSTRFSTARGFLVESQRGGGGYVKIIKLDFSSSDNLQDIIALIDDQISFKQSQQILELLAEEKVISQQQKEALVCLFSDKSLANPFKLQPYLRANMLKELIYNQLKEE